MKKFFLYCLLIFTIINYAYALEEKILKKYPKTLLTHDYNILTENDMKIYNSEFERGVNSWQCFLTSAVSFYYENTDYDPDLKMQFAMLIVKVMTGKGVLHKYEYKRGLPIEDCQDKKIKWSKLMKNEKYVCIGGSYVDQENIINHGKKLIVAGWVFDRIKTKKGTSL